MNILPQDWTHKSVQITDIRKIPNIYALRISSPEIDTPLMVNEKIFRERLKMYFLKDYQKVTREEILSTQWNFYITKGHYIKIANGEVQEFQQDPNKWYVSYLEPSGDLAEFKTIYSSNNVDNDR